MSSASYFLKRYKNKIGALTFIVLGIAFFLGLYITAEIISDWTYFRSSPLNLWNFMITAVCYLFLLVTNIRNDNAAYSGIFMFITLIVLEGIFNIIDIIRLYNNALFSGNLVVSGTFIGYCVFLVASVVIGVLFYISVYRYMTGRSNDFMRVRIFAVIFGAILLTSTVALMVFYGYCGVLTSVTSTLLAGAIPISELLMSVGVIFTLERLRRL